MPLPLALNEDSCIAYLVDLNRPALVRTYGGKGVTTNNTITTPRMKREKFYLDVPPKQTEGKPSVYEAYSTGDLVASAKPANASMLNALASIRKRLQNMNPRADSGDHTLQYLREVRAVE